MIEIKIMFVFAVCLATYKHIGSEDVTITFKVFLESNIRVVSERYLSVGIDSGVIDKRWETLNFSSPRLLTLALALSPCYLRLGGTAADLLIFDPKKIEKGDKPTKNFTMTGADWMTVTEFTQKVKWDLLFDFNVLLRTSRGWDDTNARQLLDFAIGHNRDHNLHFQLGNEPNSFFHQWNRSLSAVDLANDFHHLNQLLHYELPYAYTFNKSLLVGPDVTNARISQNIDSLLYLADFLNNLPRKTLDAVTWHQYYFDGKTAKLVDFLNTVYMDQLTESIDMVKKVKQNAGFGNLPLWISETGSAYGGGAPTLSESFLSTFLWLDKLGIAARQGIDVIIRQTLYGGHYHMIDNNLEPLPDYWVALLYKRLVGAEVLNVTLSQNMTNKFRVYAHCSQNKTFPSGSVTLFMMNLDDRPVSVVLPSTLQRGSMWLYSLTSHGHRDLLAKIVSLNGRKLVMPDDHTLPELKPVVASATQTWSLPETSLMFIVLPEAVATACLHTRSS